MAAPAKKPLIYAALGARGTGKSAWAKQLIERAAPRRLAVWDYMQEHRLATNTESLGEAIRAMKAQAFAIAFRPSRDDKTRAAQFDLWCRALLAAPRTFCHVEELAFVTTPFKAPGPWREMVLLGRHAQHALTICGTSQRPAQIDKDFLGSADLVHCGRLLAKGDAQKAGEVLGVPFGELLMLADLHYIERAVGCVSATRGVLSFAGKAGKGRAPNGAHPKGAKLQGAGTAPNTAAVPTPQHPTGNRTP